ncbi:hypothetical protein DFQ01_12082 [Paenibacillus cellulosilyticus]|uniref:Uncharacterized protein n=1 Tax=Paenibacillus cellulosilyticus TaxID=375489 RepID=A0A2V2YP99_9BACL|nr:hypothetical protein [Paenibacillus cellulosilyticus]PWV97895.1 hypothetical protein DFQ01_12082 [Paenibacillus cellulosilyticus]QKS46934.1 hypothetical protein HUB94_20905 [Paenibacillus cellulosilyticus]
MGYDVHITKIKPWFRSMSSPITEIEWRTIVSHDTNIHFVNELEKSFDSSKLHYYNNGIAVLSYTEDEGKTTQTYLDFRDGRIVVKYPDAKVIQKMKQIALLLNAYVIGDEGEEY